MSHFTYIIKNTSFAQRPEQGIGAKWSARHAAAVFACENHIRTISVKIIWLVRCVVNSLLGLFTVTTAIRVPRARRWERRGGNIDHLGGDVHAEDGNRAKSNTWGKTRFSLKYHYLLYNPVCTGLFVPDFKIIRMGWKTNFGRVLQKCWKLN